MKENLKIRAARVELGGFLAERRKQMRRTQSELAEYTAMPVSTINGIETGKFIAGIDQILAICQALELKPFFSRLEMLGKGGLANLPKGPDFLICPDGEAGELYILHRKYPACLIHIVQTTPVTFRCVDLYDKISEEDLAVNPFWEGAKEFWKNHINNSQQKN